jgi:hypothetical protein
MNQRHQLKTPPTGGASRQPSRGLRAQRFRWHWLAVPLACMVFAYLLHTAIPPAFDWEDIMIALHVPSHGMERYTRLCVLGLSLMAILAVLRLLRGRDGP